MVPKRGLEPPHPCEYMDLNHARLPIPPFRHGATLGQSRNFRLQPFQCPKADPGMSMLQKVSSVIQLRCRNTHPKRDSKSGQACALSERESAPFQRVK